MKQETVKRVLAFAVCVIFAAVTLLSMTFVLAHTHHEHDHDGPDGNCAVCTHLTAAGNLLKLLVGALVCAAFGLDIFSAIGSTLRAVDFHAALSTLVHQKIKLNI